MVRAGHRAVAGAVVLGAAWALSGCRDLLGLGSAQGDACHFASDCLAPLKCVDSVCIASGSVVATPDANPPEDVRPSDGAIAPDALPAPDGSYDAAAIACPAAYRQVDRCLNGECAASFPWGPSREADADVPLPTLETTFCAQIHETLYGDVTGIGIRFKFAIAGILRLGLYADDAGIPGALLGQTADLLVNAASADGPLEHVVSIAPMSPLPAVWVCFATSAWSVRVETVPNWSSIWTQTSVTPAGIANWLDAGLPDAWSMATPISLETPVIFLWLIR